MINRRLGFIAADALALNQAGEPVTALGVLAGYPDRAELISAECVQPREVWA